MGLKELQAPKGASEVIVFFNTTLCRSAFSTVSFRKLVFRLSVLSLNQDIKIYVIMLCNFDI